MTSLDTTPIRGGIQPFTRKPNPVDKRKRQMGLTPRVRIAVEAMANEGLGRADAAKAAGLTERAMFDAFRKPEVLAHWNACLQVLRTSERARNHHRLVQIRGQDANLNAAVAATKQLELDADTKRDASGQRVTMPGVMVVINPGRPDTHVDVETIEIGVGEAHE